MRSPVAPVTADLVTRAVAHGGTVVPALNPYWDDGAVTIADPDGYRVVLTQRSWGRNEPLSSLTTVILNTARPYHQSSVRHVAEQGLTRPG
jgi:hypothetical protein